VSIKKIQIEIELGENELHPNNCRGCKFDIHGWGCSLLSEIDKDDGTIIPKKHDVNPYSMVDKWCPLKKYLEGK
jgi:hypothetical protein